MNKFLTLLALVLWLPLFAQRDTLHGRVRVAGANATGVFVINKNTGTEVKTQSGGLFAIPAQNADRLVVYSDKTVVREFNVSAEAFKSTPYVLEVEPQGYQLDEVVIDKTITAESLGLVPKGQKQNTPAERRLYTAAGDKPLWFYAIGLLFGSMPVDPFINAVTGRTKMLKKELATEQKLMAIEKISTIYTPEELNTHLLVPAERAQGFLFYAAEEPTIAAALAGNDTVLAKTLMIKVAEQYNSLQPVMPLKND